MTEKEWEKLADNWLLLVIVLCGPFAAIYVITKISNLFGSTANNDWALAATAIALVFCLAFMGLVIVLKSRNKDPKDPLGIRDK